MTIHHAIAVFDLATQTFGRPFFAAHPAQAVRSFTDEINKPDSELAAHPSDYDLYYMGTFDDYTGDFGGERRQLVRGADLRPSTKA